MYDHVVGCDCRTDPAGDFHDHEDRGQDLRYCFLSTPVLRLAVLGIGLLVCIFSRIYSRHFKYLHKEVQRTEA